MRSEDESGDEGGNDDDNDGDNDDDDDGNDGDDDESGDIMNSSKTVIWDHTSRHKTQDEQKNQE